MREPRLGDDIDDYCVRCKRVMNHSVVSIINAEPAKVRCRICHSDHDFRHEQAPPPKVDLRKQALFNEVLQHATPQAPVPAIDDVDEPPVAEEAEAKPVEKPRAKVKAAPPAAEPKAKAKAKTAAKVKPKARK